MHASGPHRRIGWTILPLVLTAPMMTGGRGCVVDVSNPPPGNSNDNDPIPANEVVIRFRNLAENEAVDVEFYSTAGPIGNIQTDLFAEANRITDNIGFAGSGLMPPGTEDEITLTCSEVIALGTSGGTFLDPDTGEVLGEGRQRVIQKDVQFSCGDRITFTYRSTEDGFTTGIELE